MVQTERGLEPVPDEPTPYQIRLYVSLSTAIAQAVDGGRSVPCLLYPALFQRAELDLGGRTADHGVQGNPQDLCADCPVLEKCHTYVDSGVAVHGFVAGSWRLT